MSRIVKTPSIVLPQITFGPSSTNAASGGVIDLTPRTDFGWADELTFYIYVNAINGSPTSGNLTAKFQLGTPHISGNQFSKVGLFDLDAAQIGTLIAEGEDWGTVASYNSATPLVVKRTILGFGSICNLHLDASSLAGGTSPTFTITVVMTAKGA